MRPTAPRAAGLAGLLLVFALGLAGACRSALDAHAAALEPRVAPFDVERYDLDLAIDPVARRIQGTCRVRLWPTEGALQTVALDFEGLAVEAVTDREGRALEFEHADGVLSIRLVEPVGVGDFAEVGVRYAGRPDRGLWFSGERDGVPTQVFTQGQPRDAHRWFPCVDEPYERAASELVVRVPRAWSVLCAGERLERREEGAQAVERWRVHFPHPAYLEALVAGELEVRETSWDGVPLLYAAEPRLAGELEASLGETPRILEFLSRATGVRYPYPKYAQVAVDGFPTGGMENLSATTLTETAVTDAAARADQPATNLVAHEAAHQWFGDLVTCRDWSHLWLNEGFATYFAALYTQEARGEDAFRVEMDDLRARWLVRDGGANGRPLVYGVCRDPFELFGSGHVYEGAAARLHQLRALLGDAAFFRGVQTYLALHRGRAVVTDDLRRALEEASGRDLERFFERWFLRPGHPVLKVGWSHDVADGELHVALLQQQDGPAFPALVEVEVADARGVRVERVEMDGREARATLPQAEAPRWVRADPRCAFPGEILETRTWEAWFALLADAPDAAGRRAAAAFLGDQLAVATDAATRAELVRRLAERAAAEPDGTVRLRIVRGLANAAEPAAPAALRERAASDADPAVRAAALRALEPLAREPEVAALAERELERRASNAAGAAALGVLARARPDGALERLGAEARRGSPHGEWAAHVLAEVARLDDPRRLVTLRAWALDESADEAPRRVAIVALAQVAAQDEAVREDLLKLLASRRTQIVREAIAALSRALTPEVRARLAQHARATDDPSERRAIQDVLASEA